ncbi:hypothetical protein OB955_08615 [Halobacteria archaeon AArc-m2/3/4]|uniref:SurA N-terminal domain-containing protein n=1 Tax=Natronoglomus mannanivorans TaxID=2979990 RepID=A0ABT2QD32_9EURY|nr:hypothetical protein [Halobacteria archaeon AArc-m2/3/4]
MRRRQVLASGTALLSVVIAGCSDSSVVLEMDAATAEDIVDEMSTTPESDSEEYTIVSSARENGSATRRERFELFRRTDTVRLEDSFYDVTETELESNEVTVYDLLVESLPVDSATELDEIEYSDLPEMDRQRLDQIASADDQSDGGGFEIVVGYGTAEEVGDGSVFVPERQYSIVVHEGDRYLVSVHPKSITENEYRYEVTEVASTVDAFADRIRERYLFELTVPSDAERSVVEEAIADGYVEDDDLFQSVVDRIRERDGLSVADFRGTWLLEYEGVEYLAYAEWIRDRTTS